MKIARRVSLKIFFLSIMILFPFVTNAEADRASVLAAPCAGCHGTDGKSPGFIPSIHGRDASYIVETMQAFKQDKRPSTVMNRIAKGYTDEEIQLMAGYFSR